MVEGQRRGWVAVALVACAFAGVLLAAAPARAATTGYYVYNLTGDRFEVAYVREYAAGFEPSPPGPPHPQVGQPLWPGADPGRNHLEIVDNGPVGWNEPRDSAGLRYCAAGKCVKVYVDRDRAQARCTPDGAYVCGFDGTTFQIMEPPGTSHTLPAADKVAQAAALRNRVCSERNISASLGGCQFLPVPRVAALGEPHLAGDVVLNCDTTPTTVSMSFSDTQVLSNSAGLRLGDDADTDFIFQRGLRFVQPWTERHTFQGDASVAVPPGHIGFVVARNPVARDTGEFVLQIGNTHFYLKDLSFDSPDASRQPEYATTTQPMTPEQRQEECSSGGLRKVPASFASIERRGTAAGDALTGGRERTLMRGLGGDDILRGGGGSDVLDGGSGDDRLYGGPGSDRFADPSGRTVVHTGGAPRSRPDVVDVRDGKGDDTVVCGSRRTVVKADRRDRLRNCLRPPRRG